MSDALMTFSLDNLAVRGQMIQLDKSYKTILAQHHYPTNLATHLGETLAVAALLMSTLKIEAQITVQFDGEGPIKMLVAKCNHRFEIRGLAQYDASMTKNAIEAAFSAGRLAVTIEPDKRVRPYQSIIALSGGSITQAIESYFLQSEQLPTRIIIASNKDYISGFMLQQVPDGAKEQDWEHALVLANSLTQDELLNLSFEAILHRLYHQDTVRVYPKKPVTFKCPCSIDRMGMAIKTMGYQDAMAALAESHALVVTCEYCNNEYPFHKEEVETMFKKSH